MDTNTTVQPTAPAPAATPESRPIGVREAMDLPLDQYLARMGHVAVAKELAAHGDQISRNRGEGLMVEASPQAQAAIAQNRLPNEAAPDAQLQQHLDSLYAPPASPSDYRIPPVIGREPTDEEIAGNTAFTHLIHKGGVNAPIGNAIMADVSANQPHEHSPERLAALRPWAHQMVQTASRDPAMSPYVRDVSVDTLLGLLSPETVVALLSSIQHRATRR